MNEFELNQYFIRFYISETHYLEFSLDVPISDVYRWIWADGYLITPDQKYQIFFNDYLDWAMHHMVKALNNALSATDPIKPEMFEQGAGYYKNLTIYFEPDDDSPFRDSPFQTVYEKYLEPSINNESLYFLSNNNWLYYHDGKIYLEFAEPYEWDECDEADYRAFELYMQNYSFLRFEITPETAQKWVFIGEVVMESLQTAAKVGKLWGPVIQNP